MADAWKNGAAIVGSGLIALLIAELALRWLWPSPPRSVLMMSPPAMVMAREGVVTYAPDTELRVAAADGHGIIYDVKVRTNNVGLLDDVAYSPRDGDDQLQIALVGDSFTAGYHGGQPWVPALRAVVPPDWKIYGLGVDGTGIQHFDALLKYVDPAASFDRVFVVAIGNDFYRDHWYVTPGREGVWFCRVADSPERCTDGTPPIIHHLLRDASDAEALASAQNALQLANHNAGGMRLPALIRQASAALFAPSSTERLGHLAVVENLQALERIVGRYGGHRVAVIHLPALPEIIEGAYDLNLAKFATERGIPYFPALTECPFSVDMFHPREPHPNAAGYAHITRCVEQFMRKSII